MPHVVQQLLTMSQAQLEELCLRDEIRGISPGAHRGKAYPGRERLTDCVLQF